MYTPIARRRALASLVALPLVLSTAPFTGVAVAATTATISVVSVPGGKVGPNAGYLDPNQGVSGTTAIARIVLSDPSVTLQQLVIKVGGPSISIFRDFATNDGFALYKDLGAAGFTTEDHVAGAVTDGIRAGTPSGGRTPITINAVPEKATGSAAYLLTVHPANVNVGDRPFTVTIDANALSTSDSSTSSPAVAIPTLTVDSRPPTTPLENNFDSSGRQRPPGQEDGVQVSNERTEADKLLGFYVASADSSTNALITRPDDSFAVYPAPPFPAELKLGDGTGRTKSNSVATNNQREDNIFVRSLDSVGNLSPALTLATGKNNDVTAIDYTSWTVSIPGAINATNRNAVPVSTSGSSAFTDYHSEMLRLVGLDLNGNQIAFTDWKTITRTNQNNPSPAPTIDAQPLGNTPTRAIAQSRLVDLRGNVQDVVQSAPVNIDLTRPQIMSVSMVQDTTPNGISAGDKFRVFFSEAIVATAIRDTDGARQTCQQQGGTCVNNQLPVGSGAANWGTDPGFDWSTDGLSGTITLGSPEPTIPCQPPAPCVATKRLPQLGDIVDPVDALTDVAGNTIPNAVAITDPGLLPSFAETRDLGGDNLFAQGADGRLDTVDVTMSGALLTSSLAPDNFRVTGSAGALTPVGVALVENNNNGLNDEVRLVLPTNTMLTGELPVVSLVEPSPGAGTGLRGVDNRPVPSFALGTIDRARPALIEAKTKDDNGNGHIDQVVLTYSEPIDHSREDTLQVGYRVFGYENRGTTGNTANTRTPTSGMSNTTIVELAEKAADFDTEALPAFEYRGTRADVIQNGLFVAAGTFICDKPAPAPGTPATALGNCRGGSPAFQTTLTDPYFDAAQPVIVVRKTFDVDADGWVDAVATQFSEPLRTETVSNGVFAVTDRTVTGVTPVFVGNPDTVYVQVQEATGEGDTATKLKLKYTGGTDGGVHDAAVPASNPARTDSAEVESADGAGPAITAAGHVPAEGGGPGDGTKVNVLLSEPTEQMAVGDFSVAGISKANGQSVIQEPTELTPAADKKSVVLTLGTAIDPSLDGTVEFTGAGVVTDQVTPTPNLNTQITPVPVPPYPIAFLDAVGPAGSNPGYSISKTFSTGASGNSGVTGWCLKFANVPLESAPTAPTAADDPCFKVETPATLTVPIDGNYSLLLVTKNQFGNLSAPATDSIVVDSSPPVITSTFLERLGVGLTGTVRDNDTVRVVMTTSGSNPGSFTATADYSALTGNPNDTAVPSLSRNGGTFRFPFRVASGTTVYPVGTVLQVNNDAGQPFVLEDGPDGKVVKRRFLSAQAMSTYRIPSSLVIRVPAAVLNPVPTGETKYYRDGQLVRASNSPAVYVISENKKHHIPNRGVFEDMRYSFSSVIAVPAADLAKVPDGDAIASGKHPVGTYIRNNTQGNPDFGKTYIVLRGADGEPRKRHVVSSTALLSHITINQVVNLPSDHTSLKDVQTDALKRGLRDGMLIREPNDPRVFAISRGARRHINSRGAFELMGFSFRNVVAVGPEHLGIPTDSTVPVGTRRVPFSVTVHDAAGHVATRPSTVVGLGIPEPLPETAPGAPRP